jgi:hypothetical protein
MKYLKRFNENIGIEATISNGNIIPNEINEIIASYYNIDIIYLQIKIVLTPMYPFHPPEWLLLAVKNNFHHSMNLHEYYQYIVDNHNQQYTHYWSPASDIEKDVVDFIRKINHFDLLFD